MADPQGFLKARRIPAPRRPVHERIRDYRHVYTSLPPGELQVQASRCMDCGVPACNVGCPLGNLIPDWNDLVHRDRWRAAIGRLHLTNNFPEFTGLLCPAPCEAACVLAINDDAVGIKEIELGIVDRAFEEGWIVPQSPRHRTGKRVAVVGSGPAGLAAAQQLNRAGHRVVVFEKDDKPGGLLRYGIPDFKIEKWVVDRRLDLLRDEGIELVAGCEVGVNPTVVELWGDPASVRIQGGSAALGQGRARQEPASTNAGLHGADLDGLSGAKVGFDAVLLAVGALQGQDLTVPGRELAGVHLAMEYLTQRNRAVACERIDPREEITARGKRVVIIGGGDTGADCLGNAHREGAASVQVLTHGPRPPDSPDPLAWPDWPFVLRTYPAHEEGGERRWNVVITSFSGRNGRVERIHCSEVERSPDGRLRHIPGTDHELEADLVLLAIGFAGPVRDRLLRDLDLDLRSDGSVAADDHFRTSVPGVFAAGDARRGASLIVWAIAEGRAAAQEIDCFLTGNRAHPRSALPT